MIALITAGMLLAAAGGHNAPAAAAAEAADASGPIGSRRPESATVQFLAEGSVDYYNFLTAEDLKAGRSEFTRVASNTVSFSVAVSNSCYLLRLVPTTEGAIQYQEAGFDGQTLYYVLQMPPFRGPKPPGVQNELNVANAWIFDQQRVVYSVFAHHMAPVWLMFASGDYLRTVTNGLVEPPVTIGLFENLDYFPRPFKIPAQWSLQQAFPFLPLRVTCQDDGETKTEPPFQNVKRTPPFDAGFTNIVFQVTGTRKFDAAEVPCSGDVDTYGPCPGGKPKLFHYRRYHLALTKWSSTIPPTTFRPKLPGLTTISDARHARSEHPQTSLAREWPE